MKVWTDEDELRSIRAMVTDDPETYRGTVTGLLILAINSRDARIKELEEENARMEAEILDDRFRIR